MAYVGRCAAVSQVMSTLAELAKSQIGRTNCFKCVVADDGIHSDMFQCAAHLLRNLDIEHPVYNVINSVVQSHHATHGNCCKTLLVMAGLWFQEMQQITELGITVGEISGMFDRGLEASVDHLMHSSSVLHLNDDLTVTSTEDASYGFSAAFEADCEDISSSPESEVTSVPSNSVGCVEKFDSRTTGRQSLAEDEDVGWFFEEESRDEHLLDACDSDRTVFTELVNSNVDVYRNHVTSQDFKRMNESDFHTEEVNNAQLCCSDLNSSSRDQRLEIEDEFEDCFSDAVFGFRDLTISDSRRTSQTLNCSEGKCSNDISNQNSTNLVLPNDGLRCGMLHKNCDSNSEVTRQFPSQCGNTGNSASCNGDFHLQSKDKTKDFLYGGNAVKHQIILNGTKDFACENTAKFPIRHSDLVEKDIHPSSYTAFDGAKHTCSNCVLTADNPDCHCTNDTCILVEPDCLILSQDVALKSPNCPPASAERQPPDTSSFNFSNRFSRHSLAISSAEESRELHATECKQNSDDELQYHLISNHRTPRVLANSAVGDHLETFHHKTLIAADKDCIKSNDCDLNKAAFSDDALKNGNAQTTFSHGMRDMPFCSDHEKTSYGIIQDSEGKTLCEDNTSKTTFGQRLAMLGSKLSHGADDMMKLVFKMADQQLKDDVSNRLERDLIHTCCLDGIAEDKTCVVDGLLIPIAVDQIPLISGERDSKRSKRALLINGDLTSTFCHQGYRKVTKVTRVRKMVSSETESRSEIWMNQVLKTIEQLDVGILFVKGSVDENLLYRCIHQNVVVFEGASYGALSAIGLCTNAPLNLYISDCTECCVARGVELQLWMCEWVRKRESMKHFSYVTVNVPSSSLPVQTAVICHPVASVTHVKDEQLLHCVHRLCSSIRNRTVLVGGGTAETVCALFLEQLADYLEKDSSGDTDLVTATIYRSMARGFRRFVDNVLNNIDNNAAEPLSQMVYDDCESKLETWRTASCLVILLLRCDMEIVAKTPKPSQDLIIGYL